MMKPSIKNQKKLEKEINRTYKAIEYLMKIHMLLIPQDINPETLLDRISEHITGQIKVEIKN